MYLNNTAENISQPTLYDVTNFDGQTNAVGNEFNKFAYLHSGAFREIFGQKQKDCIGQSDVVEGYLKITNPAKGQNIFLRYHSWNSVHKNEVMLSYPNLCILGIDRKEGGQVKIEESCWFCYYYYNSDSGVRAPFRIALISLFLTILGQIISHILS